MRIEMLGPPRVVAAGRVVEIATIRAAALLWFLAAHPEGMFSRDEIVSLLWDAVGLDEGRNRLNTTLTRLRQSLPQCPVRSDRRAVGWDNAPKLTVDTVSFLQTLDEVSGASEPSDARRRLEEILAWRRGPFLAGFHLPDAPGYEEWLSHQRLEWDQRLLDSWERLVGLDARVKDWQAVHRHAAAALHIDPWQEKFHRWIMTAHHRLGDRAAALTHFQRLGQRLRQELESEPDPETIALAESIRRGTVQAVLPTESAAPRADAPRPVAGLPRTQESSPWELPWVGRVEELQRLRTMLEPGKAGARLVVVEGPVGIGKTRLIREALNLQVGETDRWAICYQTMQTLPYVPWITLIREEVRRRGAESVPPPWRGALSRILPELEYPPGVQGPPVENDCGTRQRQICEAVVHYWASLDEPLVVVLDDLQWADEASWATLTLVMESRVLDHFTVVAALRPDGLHSAWRQQLEVWRREEKAAFITLGPLSAVEVEQLAQVIWPHRSREWAETLYRDTKGHPLFLTEVARAARKLPAGSQDPARVPNSVRDVVQYWLGHLSPSAQRLAEALAVFSTPVALAFLRQVASMPEDSALEAWQELLHSGVIEEEWGLGQKDWLCQRFPGVRGVLYHDLVRSVIQESMPRSKWAVLHRRAVELGIGAAKEGVYDAGFLAYHAGEAGMWEEATRWSLIAAEAAETLGAYAEAVRWLEVTAAHLQRLPETAERRRAWVDVRLRLALLSWHTAPHQGIAALEAIDPERALPEGGELRAAWWLRRMEGMLLSGRLNQAQAVLRRVVPWTERLGPAHFRGIVLLRLGQLRATAGELSAASQDFALCAPLLEAAPPPWYAECIGTWATVLAALGEFEQARRVLQTLAQWTPGWRHPTVPIVATVHELTVHSQQGDWSRAVEVGRRLLERLKPGDHPTLEYVGLIYLALPMAALGDASGAVGVLHQAMDLGTRLGMRILRDRAWAWLGEILIAAGQYQPALEAAQEGLRIAQEDGYRVGEGINLRVLGAAQAALGDRTHGLATLRRALDILTSLQARPEVMWCHRRLAAFCDGLQAVSHYQLAQALAGEMGMPWRPEVELACW
ncbi:MAG: AAA family ATPase [Firmicutes bacterium]|nr:AAA family ATPase [Alicyclobacillaceae bacterium]MCL6498108.1 AAA family ATPase [Bacillota bacterium]